MEAGDPTSSGGVFDDRDALERTSQAQKAILGALRESEQLARAVVESASEGIIITDRAGAILLVNARTEALFGYQRAELIGQPLEILIPERARAAHVAH
jgi:PAS domain-containing protein